MQNHSDATVEYLWTLPKKKKYDDATVEYII